MRVHRTKGPDRGVGREKKYNCTNQRRTDNRRRFFFSLRECANIDAQKKTSINGSHHTPIIKTDEQIACEHGGQRGE